MKVPIKQLSNLALDYAVGSIEGFAPGTYMRGMVLERDFQGIVHRVTAPINRMYVHYSPSTLSQGDDIIDREGITVIRCDDDYETDAKGFSTNKRIPVWAATIGHHGSTESTEHQQHNAMYQIEVSDVVYGSTRREAAMRAYVAWKNSGNSWDMNLEGTVEVPEEIL